MVILHLGNFATKAYHWFSSIIAETTFSIVMKTLSAGPMPRHMAFIMDGNRRYARMHGIPESQGHTNGYYQLNYLMRHWLDKTNIECVSVYGWSILNFGRKESEVADAMKLMEESLNEFWTLYGAPRKAWRPCQLPCRFLNIYLAYTSADEMTRSVEACVNASIDDSQLRITPTDIALHLDTFYGNDIPMPPVDILVRTSGAKRFSDFLLWQACCTTQVQFVPTLWPIFGPRDLFFIILDYQRKIYH